MIMELFAEEIETRINETNNKRNREAASSGFFKTNKRLKTNSFQLNMNWKDNNNNKVKKSKFFDDQESGEIADDSSSRSSHSSRPSYESSSSSESSRSSRSISMSPRGYYNHRSYSRSRSSSRSRSRSYSRSPVRRSFKSRWSCSRSPTRSPDGMERKPTLGEFRTKQRKEGIFHPEPVIPFYHMHWFKIR